LNINLPESHPRYESLLNREKIIQGLDSHVVAPAGLIAQGRGEAFDYLIGEKTWSFAEDAALAAVVALLDAQNPVLSVNGNVAALDAAHLVRFSKLTGAALEINLFYRSPGREEAIFHLLEKEGAENVLGMERDDFGTIPELQSDRRVVSKNGIYKADVVFVPLEDGDRTEALVKMGKKVITVDLNPLSRTAQRANISIVDNIVRILPLMCQLVPEVKQWDQEKRKKVLSQYDNTETLSQALAHISNFLSYQFQKKEPL